MLSQLLMIFLCIWCFLIFIVFSLFGCQMLPCCHSVWHLADKSIVSLGGGTMIDWFYRNWKKLVPVHHIWLMLWRGILWPNHNWTLWNKLVTPLAFGRSWSCVWLPTKTSVSSKGPQAVPPMLIKPILFYIYDKMLIMTTGPFSSLP